MVSLVAVTLLVLPLVQSANILFVVVSPSYSHQIVFQPIWRELSLRGHQVTVITPDPLRDSSLTNLTEIDVSSIYEYKKKALSVGNVEQYMFQKPSFLHVFLKDSFVTKIFSQLMERVFQHENVQKFLSEEHHFDVAVIEWLYPTMAAFGAKFNCPFIGITSLGAPVVALDTVGNPSHPVYAPDHNLPLTRNMDFRERLMASLYSVYVRAYYHAVVLPREDALAKKYLGENLPYLGDVERNISLLLLNRNPVFHRIFPVVPAIIEFGGMKLNTTREKLDEELQSFLDKSKNGVVYFSLGTNVGSNLLPKNIRDIFHNCFAQLPFNVIWKTKDVNDPATPKNILKRSWVPQEELLAHKNVKLFIMQGGLQSTEEAIASHVPIIGIPFESDKVTNVDTCVKYGAGELLDLEEITFEKLNSTIHKIVADKRYKENMIKLDQLMHDQPQDGLEKTVWWIEYVIRHKGARHLRSPALDISWTQFLMLDIIAFVGSILLLVLLVFYKSCKLILRVFKTCGKKDEKKKKL